MSSSTAEVKKRPVSGAVRAAGSAKSDTNAVFVLPLNKLVGYDNPRREPERLFNMGYVLVGDPDIDQPELDEDGRPRKFVSLLHMALDDNPQRLEYFIKLIEENESVNRAMKPNAPQSITELAEDIRLYGQLEEAKVHEAKDGWHLDNGGRRACAILYLHAQDRLKMHKKAEDAPKHAFPAEIRATTLQCADDTERFLKAAKINISSKRYTPLQEGFVYHRLLATINPDTLKGKTLYDGRNPKGRPYTMKEAAATIGVHYSTFRNREALWHDYRVLKRDTDGKIVKRRGLTEDERRRVAEGTMLATYASRLSLGESTAGVSKQGGSRVVHKNKPLTIREMEGLFDNTPADQIERRTAIAECMRKTYAQALKESRQRADEAMDRYERAHGMGGTRKGGKGRHAGAAA